MEDMGRFWNSGEARVYNTVLLTSGVGHLGRLHSSNRAKDKAKLIKNTSYIPYIQTVSIL